MQNPRLIHIFSPTKNVSPFDVNMAYESGFDGVVPYTEVTLDDIHALTQDTIFSRGPTGVKRTCIFIGGREFGLAAEMLEKAKSAMVSPFAVSVFVDPSGAITTAAALIAIIEKNLKRHFSTDLNHKALHIFGGTGPVGICAAVLAASCGATPYLVSHRGEAVAREIAREYNNFFGVNLAAAGSANDNEIAAILGSTQVVIGAAKAGIQILHESHLQEAKSLMVAADVNAVPPAGIAGIGLNDNGAPLSSASLVKGIGALAIGNVKYQVHREIFNQIQRAEHPLYADHHTALRVARDIVAAAD